MQSYFVPDAVVAPRLSLLPKFALILPSVSNEPCALAC